MTARNDLERGATIITDLASRFRLPKAGGAISGQRCISLDSSGNGVQSSAGARDVVGVNPSMGAIASGKHDIEVAYGACYVEADGAISPKQRLKVADGGKVIQAVDSTLTGDVITNDGTAGNFGNQPANDGVEIVSAAAGDTTQSITLWYTRNGQGDTVYSETKALNGTTQVVLTHTDVQLVLAAELSAVTAGNVTIREASADATITTITAGGTKAGIEEVEAADQNAYNVAPTIVAGGASTKQVGLIGTNSAGAAIADSQALNGTTAVTANSAFKTVTRVLLGDVATGTTVTVSVGAEDDEEVIIGKALGSTAAAGDLLFAFINPR